MAEATRTDDGVILLGMTPEEVLELKTILEYHNYTSSNLYHAVVHLDRQGVPN